MSEGSKARYDLNGDAWRGSADGRSTVMRGPGYLYRAGHVLVEDEQAFTSTALGRLREVSATPHEEVTASFSQAGLPVLAFQVPDGVHIPTLIARLRQHEHDEATPNVGPNHVFTGEYEYEGGPGSDPEPAPKGNEYPVPEPFGPARIAILDTGFDRAVKHLHPGLAERLEHDGDEDPLAGDGHLAHEAGHGTFIAGIVMRLAPELRIRQVRVLDPAGVGDDATIAAGLALAREAVLNLSLGGYTHDGRPPVALAAALGQLDDSVAVVAAAGNNASPEPFWPAAFKRVVAVGALDTTGDGPVRAGFSNYGHWVDVYAPGTRVHSMYLDGSYLEADKHLAHLKGWAHWSGTSFAAPHVAAEIAKRVRDGVSARQAAYQVLAAARWLPGVGPVVLPG
ncbi:MAG TPA: S8 family serine peptidase [Trebonia sp.]